MIGDIMEKEEVIRIAYADDHVAVREGITALISRYASLEVIIQAGNGQELIDRIAASTTIPDVCLLDINMPVKNGFETQLELMSKWPQINTLVLTAHDLEWYIIRLILAGARGFLLKSCCPAEIERAVLSVHMQGYYYSELAPSQLFNSIRNKEIKLPHLTIAEADVLRLCCSDLSYEQIAAQLGTTRRSVEGHRDALFKKLKVNSRPMLVLCAVEMGLVPLLQHLNPISFPKIH